MAALAQLISLGFRNPGAEERNEIINDFVTNSNLLNNSLTNDRTFNGMAMNIDENGGVLSLGTNGKICRFVQLLPEIIAHLYNNPAIPNGAKAVPRLEPARIFTNSQVKFALVLYASNGYLVICEEPGNLLAHEFVDPALALNGTKRNKPSKATAQHIPRPPNAFIIYRNCKMGDVKRRYPELGNNDISKVIGKLWHAETQAVKDEFKLLARRQTQELLQNNPTYKYQPRKTTEILRRPGLKRTKISKASKTRKA